MFGSVRLVQEVSRSASSSPTLTPTESTQVEDLSHHQQQQQQQQQQHTTTTTTTTTTNNTSETTPNIKVNSQPTLINNVIPIDYDNDIDDSHTQTNTDYNTNIDDHDSINNEPMTELTINKSQWTGLQKKTSITVPTQQVNYPVSLASYLPGITPGYANSRTTLPSWMVNNSTSTLNARSKRKHTRENSFYSIRQHKPKQPSLSTLEQEDVLNMQSMQQQQQQHVSVSAFTIGASPNNITSSSQQQQNTPLLTFNNNNNDDDNNNIKKMGSLMINDKFKPKSQKLLCLWPLPIITRYIIGISFLVSIMNFLGFFHLKCSSPSYVIHRLEIMNLLLSPFLFTGSLQTFLLFGWNILILGLFEESLAHMLGGTRRFVKVLVGIILSVCMIRQGIGYLFSKSTGFAVPSLFFSDSLHECNQGIKNIFYNSNLPVQTMN
ncbi:hypothetical protein INT45_002760, partial [Circinella minor]